MKDVLKITAFILATFVSAAFLAYVAFALSGGRSILSCEQAGGTIKFSHHIQRWENRQPTYIPVYKCVFKKDNKI